MQLASLWEIQLVFFCGRRSSNIFKAKWVWREAGNKAKQTSKERASSTRAPRDGPQMLQGRGEG